MKTKLMQPRLFSYILSTLCVAVVGAGAGEHYVVSQQLGRRSAEVSSILAETEAAQAKVTQLIQLDRQYQSVKPDLALLDEALPRQKKQSEIVLQLERLAADAGMQLPGVTFPAVQGLPGPTAQTIPAGEVLAIQATLQLNGSYQQLLTFLRSLENLARYNSVTSLSISQGEAERLSFSVVISVFTKP